MRRFLRKVNSSRSNSTSIAFQAAVFQNIAALQRVNFANTHAPSSTRFPSNNSSPPPFAWLMSSPTRDDAAAASGEFPPSYQPARRSVELQSADQTADPVESAAQLALANEKVHNLGIGGSINCLMNMLIELKSKWAIIQCTWKAKTMLNKTSLRARSPLYIPRTCSNVMCGFVNQKQPIIGK